MKKILTIAGSNSKKSINKQLVNYVATHLENIEQIPIDLNDYEMPLFGVDIEAEKGFPENAIKLNEIFNQADGFIVSLAEHNGSYTVAFKNVLDWLSRVNNKVWRNKPMLLLATSPGARGGITVLSLAKTYFPYLDATIIADYALPSFYDNFSDGKIVNQEINKIMATKIHLFNTKI